MEKTLKQNISSEADRNRMVKECLRGGAKRHLLNESLGEEVASDVYSMSLARTLFEPQIVTDGKLRTQVRSANGSVVKVWLREDRKTTVVKNAFRDSVEEEEHITIKRTLDFIDAGCVATDIKTFPVCNVHRFKAINLNGSASMMVNRAEQRMAWAMATDETRIAMHCLNWAADNRGKREVVFPASSVPEIVAKKVKRIRDVGMTPIVVCHPHTVAVHFISRYGAAPMDTTHKYATSPMAVFNVMDEPVAVYQSTAIPRGRIYVTPGGRGLGVIGISTHAGVKSYDKPAKHLLGWTCAEEIGFVLANPDMVTTVYAGLRGLLEGVKSCFRYYPKAGSVAQRVHG